MTVTAKQEGRNLHVTVEGIDAPFVVRPLPGRAGLQITDTYLGAMGGGSTTIDLNDALIIAVDGGIQNAITGIWEPVPEDQQTNFTRIGLELSQAEAESVIMPAFFWQTLLGIDGVKAYIEGGGGQMGTLKAAGALSNRLGFLARQTSPRTA